jgi:hypothetical protein
MPIMAPQQAKNAFRAANGNMAPIGRMGAPEGILSEPPRPVLFSPPTGATAIGAKHGKATGCNHGDARKKAQCGKGFVRRQWEGKRANRSETSSLLSRRRRFVNRREVHRRHRFKLEPQNEGS